MFKHMLSRVAIIIAAVAFGGSCAAMETGSEWKVVGKGGVSSSFVLASIPEARRLGEDDSKNGGRKPRTRRHRVDRRAWRKLSPEEAATYLAFKQQLIMQRLIVKKIQYN